MDMPAGVVARPLPPARARRAAWQRLLLSDYLVPAVTVLYVLALLPFVPELGTLDTALDVLAAMIPLLVVAVGQTFVLIVAGIDLSAPSVIALASVVGGSIMTADGGFVSGPLTIPAGLAAFLAVGAVVGLFNGACTSRFGMPSFIVTLTTTMFCAGAALWYTALNTDDGSSFGDLPDGFIAIAQARVFGLPASLLVALAVMGAAHLILRRTVLGAWLYAIGLNPRAAAISGVPVRRVVTIAFVLSGLCAGIASILYTGRLETGSPVMGQRILLDVIGAAVIGGVSLFGGKGGVVQTLYGVIFLSVIDKGLELLGLDLSSVFAIKGGVILLAAVLDALRHRMLARG
jgi:ribose/xylose/arabinose/galactoside ABC-type transport system permease subunit